MTANVTPKGRGIESCVLCMCVFVGGKRDDRGQQGAGVHLVPAFVLRIGDQCEFAPLPHPVVPVTRRPSCPAAVPRPSFKWVTWCGRR